MTAPASSVFRDIDAPWCPEMMVIPPGEFITGSTEAEKERPQHPVRIAYRLAVGRYPVTFEEYGHFARSTGRAQPGDEGWGRGRWPVINVTWEDAKAYVEWLAVETVQGYRMLSEAEWEYACRDGTVSRYWWGNEITPENANYGKNLGKTSEVGSDPANPFGLYDMQGNVWEWVEDRWHDFYNGAPNDGSAWTAGNDPRRVVRGAPGATARRSSAPPSASGTTPPTGALASAYGSPRRLSLEFLLRRIAGRPSGFSLTRLHAAATPTFGTLGA